MTFIDDQYFRSVCVFSFVTDLKCHLHLQLSKQLEVFQGNLEDFAAKHKDEIRRNPQFRVQFQEMCASIGVDPLACKCGFNCIIYLSLNCL